MQVNSPELELIIKGINFIWNNQFDNANELFKVNKDKDPRTALHYAEVSFLKSFITADIEDTLEAIERLKKSKELAEQHLKCFEKGFEPGIPNKKISLDSTNILTKILDTRIVLGDSLYMLATLQLTHDAKVKGVYNLRKSWKIIQKSLNDLKKIQNFDPQLKQCLYFGVGFFLFVMSIIPQKFLKLVELIGFKADREAGLHYIREVHNSGGIRGPYATMLLLFNNLILPRGLANVKIYIEEAEQLLKEANSKYPGNSVFYVMASQCARKQCDTERGIKMMEAALNNSLTFSQPPLLYRYELGNCHCMQLNWKKAIELFEPLIKVQKFQVKNMCSLQLASCYIMLNQPDQAKNIWKYLQTIGGKQTTVDKTVILQAKRYLGNGGYFSAFEILYIRRDLVKMISVMSDVLKLLDEMAEKAQVTQKKTFTSSPSSTMGKLAKFGTKLQSLSKKKDSNIDCTVDDRACYLLIRGSILKALEKHNEAIECFKEVIEMQDHLNEKMYAPYCLYELGESYYILGNNKEAEELMKACSKFSSYNWEDPLRVRLRVTMDQLKKGVNPQAKQELLSIENLTSNVGKDDADEKEDEDDFAVGEDKETGDDI